MGKAVALKLRSLSWLLALEGRWQAEWGKSVDPSEFGVSCPPTRSKR